MQDEQEYTPLELRDKCDELCQLLDCLWIMTDNPEFHTYHNKPHYFLINTIQKGIQEIEKSLRNL
jgi:hypothetical protein